ncbi:DUF169 domain-containing protein [Bacteroidota bacterium]
MNLRIKNKFTTIWNEYFPGANLPFIFYYTDDWDKIKDLNKPNSDHCLIRDVSDVRNGMSIYFENDSIKCMGGRRYLGYSSELRNNFEYFLSCGLEGTVVGERYKKSPELVKELLEKQPPYKAPGKFLILKRWDKLEIIDEPVAVIFIDSGDVLSGLTVLSNFAEKDLNTVIAPFCSGCSSIFYYPYHESLKDNPKVTLGMFDITARPYIGKHELSIAVSYKKFVNMIDDYSESFLITDSWEKIRKRIEYKVK